MTPAELVGLVPGCACWDMAPDCDPDEAEHMRGGIVYAVERRVDPETGELEDAYLWAEPWRESYRTGIMRASAVRQWQPGSSASIRSLVRRLARTVATSKGALDSRDLDAIEIAHHLTHLERPR